MVKKSGVEMSCNRLKKLPGTKPRSLKFARPNGKLNRGLKWQILCTEPENYMEPAISFSGKFWISLLCPMLKNVCMFSAADLQIRNVPFPKKVSSDSDLALGHLFPFGTYAVTVIKHQHESTATIKAQIEQKFIRKNSTILFSFLVSVKNLAVL